VEHAQKALRLSPLDPLNYHPHFSLALVYLFTDRFEDAILHATRAIQANPGFSPAHAVLAASYADLGRVDAARDAARRLLEIAPGSTVDSFVRAGWVRPALMEGFGAALCKAGLPE
jgi:tetratricopeptide (TPR) repeat protein